MFCAKANVLVALSPFSARILLVPGTSRKLGVKGPVSDVTSMFMKTVDSEPLSTFLIAAKSLSKASDGALRVASILTSDVETSEKR